MMTLNGAIKGLKAIAEWKFVKYEQTGEEHYRNDGEFLMGVAELLKAQEPVYIEERLVLDKLHTIQDYARVNEIHWMADGAAFAENVMNMLRGEINQFRKAQEPVEPVRMNHTENKYQDHYRCQICKEDLFYEQNYCSNCGRAVKWE